MADSSPFFAQISFMQLAAIQELFANHSVPPRTIATIGEVLVGDGNNLLCIPSETAEDQIVRLVSDGSSRWTVSAGIGIAAFQSLQAVAEWLDKVSCEQLDRYLLIGSAPRLRGLMTAPEQAFPFEGVVVLHRADAPISQKIELQRALFDRGLVGIGSIASNSEEAHCFLASSAVSSTRHLRGVERGRVSMSSLGTNGRFGNQLFQYAYVKLYALRHGLEAELPEWEGKEIFALPESMPDGPCRTELRFDDSMQDDRILWEMDEPPINVDLWGHFQELPARWRLHRPLLRRLFRLAGDRQRTIDAWRDKATCGGDRTLVAIHVRRGDYRALQHVKWYGLVPDEWYLDWLRAIWPTLRDPVLFIATDEPDLVVPSFREFDIVSASNFEARRGVPDHVFDFGVLRAADVLAICNSSFSRMAAILSDDDQKCFCPSFVTERITPYDPWMERFWDRFGRVREEDCRLEAIREQAISLRLALGDLSRDFSGQLGSIADLREQRKQLCSQNAHLKKQIAISQREQEAGKRRLDAILKSRFWRITSPFRRLLRLFKLF